MNSGCLKFQIISEQDLIKGRLRMADDWVAGQADHQLLENNQVRKKQVRRYSRLLTQSKALYVLMHQYWSGLSDALVSQESLVTLWREHCIGTVEVT